MRALVTGAGGFVGVMLVRALLNDGHDVIGVDLRLASVPAHAALTRVEGDIADPTVLVRAVEFGCDAIVHLATIPGGAAEIDPRLARRINVDATLDLIALASRANTGPPPRFVFASSIAVFGDRLPSEGVDDLTPVAPNLIYGGHKAMMEVAVATASRRGEIDGLSIRLPAILARPRSPSGMKSAFMSELFHAIVAGEAFTCPVSPQATIWAQSLQTAVASFVCALGVGSACLPASRALTLPALRIRIDELVDAICAAAGRPAALIAYDPDPALEQAFGMQPPLRTPAAAAAGFVDDDSIDELVRRALAIAAAPPV